jgi:hypothetical protein
VRASYGALWSRWNRVAVTELSQSKYTLIGYFPREEESMDKRIAGLLGAAAALTAVSGAQAAAPPTPLEPAASYRDLLEPVPNALALLKNEESQGGGTVNTGGETKLAYHHHHHHHHHRYWRRYYHHHHHRYWHHHHHHHW